MIYLPLDEDEELDDTFLFLGDRSSFCGVLGGVSLLSCASTSMGSCDFSSVCEFAILLCSSLWVSSDLLLFGDGGFSFSADLGGDGDLFRAGLEVSLFCSFPLSASSSFFCSSAFFFLSISDVLVSRVLCGLGSSSKNTYHATTLNAIQTV